MKTDTEVVASESQVHMSRFCLPVHTNMADICTLLFVNIIRINKVDAAVVVNVCLNCCGMYTFVQIDNNCCGNVYVCPNI